MLLEINEQHSLRFVKTDLMPSAAGSLRAGVLHACMVVSVCWGLTMNANCYSALLSEFGVATLTVLFCFLESIHQCSFFLGSSINVVKVKKKSCAVLNAHVKLTRAFKYIVKKCVSLLGMHSVLLIRKMAAVFLLFPADVWVDCGAYKRLFITLCGCRF